MNSKVKVLLVEDSGFMRILISDILRKDPELELVGTATNGREGILKARELCPDVVVTDMIMPAYDGLYVVRALAEGPAVPVILLSSLERTDTQVFEALQSGAFDFVDKPKADEAITSANLISLIKAAARSKKPKTRQGQAKNTLAHTFDTTLLFDIVVIGSSTGGPGAVEFVIDNLPNNLSIPVVVAQHMPERFIHTFAERLNAKGIFKVKLAAEGEEVHPGYVYLAGGHQNLTVTREEGEVVFRYTDERFREFNFPSVDCLFSSVAKTFGGRGIGVILTGMGKDGSVGLMQMREAGAFTIAQDESTSVVYGMPKAAFDAGAVRQVLKLNEIPGFVVSCLS